jgi:hypothetical protein
MAAAAAEDASSSSPAMSKENNDIDDNEPSSVKGMLAALHKHSDGTNVMKESIKTFPTRMVPTKKRYFGNG